MTDFTKYNKRDLKLLVNKLVPMEDLITVVPFNILCPFHDNRYTPSARFYTDEDGQTILHCFSEHRRYTSYDYLSLIDRVNPIEYIKSRFSNKELKDILEVIGDSNFSFDRDNERIDIIHNCWVDSLENPQDFIENIYNGYDLKKIIRGDIN